MTVGGEAAPEPSEHPGTWPAVDVDPARVLRELTQ
jgi:hypothetical protein